MAQKKGKAEEEDNDDDDNNKKAAAVVSEGPNVNLGVVGLSSSLFSSSAYHCHPR